MLRPILRSYPWRLVAETVRRFNRDQGAVLAGYIAYASMLAVFPFLIFAVALTGSLIGKRYSAEAVSTLFASVPEHVALTLQPVLAEVMRAGRVDVLALSALGTLYAASNGVEAIRIGLDRAYGIERPRGFLMNRLIAVGFVFVGIAGFGALSVLIILAPLGFRLVESLTAVDIPASADLARYAIGLLLLFALLWLMHRLLPSRPMHWKRLWPGILVTMAIWGLLATAMSLYVSYSPSYSVIYGTLAGVIVTLLFFFLTGVAIIFGAEVNAVLNFGLPERERDG